MTNNPTIDGVPRELLERLIDAYACHDNNPHCHLGSDQEAIDELRALLDAPAKESEIDSLRAEVEKWKGIAGRRTAERTEFMNERDDLKAAQPQGEPVCEVIAAERGARTLLWLADQLPNIGAKLYAEQPAPVAVVMPERKTEAATDEQKSRMRGWNACLDELKRLNPTRPAHANPPPGTEPSGTHRDNDGLDEMRKPICCGSCPGGCVIQSANK